MNWDRQTEKEGGEMGKSPEREREKEAQAGHPHIAHSYLIWPSFPYSTFHDSLYFSPQKQPKVGSTAAVAMNLDGQKKGGGGY